jgi:hypothetical protein
VQRLFVINTPAADCPLGFYTSVEVVMLRSRRPSGR